MNKFYLTLVMVMTFVWVSAQQVQTHKLNMKAPQKAYLEPSKKFFNQINSQKGSNDYSMWLHQPSAIALFTTSGDLADNYGIEMFPDSTMVRAEDFYGNVRYHSIAVSADPKSIIFDPNDEKEFNSDTRFSLDSMMFGYIYSRTTAASVVDTLVVQIQSNFFAWTIAAADYSWVYDIYGATEMVIPAILHDELTWEATSTDANVIATYKFPLYEADTTEGRYGRYLYKSMNNLLFQGGEFIKASFTFVPGYTWTPNVDSTEMYNSFEFLSRGNESLGEYPLYMDDYNSNAFMSTQDYRDSSDNFIPNYFFTEKPHYIQYHDVAFRVTTLNVSIENEKEFMSVSQNQPNPFNGVSTVNYSLDRAAKVNIDIFNVAGAKVKSVNEGLKTAGNHQVQIDATDLPAGIYYYTFTADNKSVTKKMIVL